MARSRHYASRALAAAALVTSSPLLGAAAVAVKVSGPGPVFYRAARTGRDGTQFSMWKFRTMTHTPAGSRARITGAGDSRVTPIGRWLRRLKIDELPQLVNVVRGEMAIIGPRPEDPSIVADHYTPTMRKSLTVLPGLSSPGSLKYFADEARLPRQPAEAERHYLTELLPAKIALDLVYVRHASPAYDLELVLRTAAGLVGWHRLFWAHQRSEDLEALTYLAAISRERSSG